MKFTSTEATPAPHVPPGVLRLTGAAKEDIPMYRIQTMNKISPVGLNRFPSELYEVGDAVQDPQGILVRSAKLLDLEFNPGLLARAFAFFANTPSMSGATVWIAGLSSGEGVVDGFSGATALENLSTTGQMGYSAMDAFLGFIPGCIGETSTLAILLGAAILLFTGVASWRTMVSVFVGGLAMGYFFQAIGVTTYPAWYHLIIGGFAFGAVFMATDPVTSAQTNTGKYIVGLLTGALAVLIRVVNPAYPEGMMLSILFMNALAPLVDYYVVEANISRRKKRVKLAK